jgi:hypothetical protein
MPMNAKFALSVLIRAASAAPASYYYRCEAGTS